MKLVKFVLGDVDSVDGANYKLTLRGYGDEFWTAYVDVDNSDSDATDIHNTLLPELKKLVGIAEDESSPWHEIDGTYL